MARIKGAGVVELVKFLRTHKTRALEVLPPDLQHYLTERVLLGSWYPERDVMGLLTAMLEVAGVGDAYERAGAIVARRNLATIYASHIQRSDPEAALRYISALWSNYHDTGREKATFTGSTCRIEISDFGIVDADYCRVIGAYNRELIELTGGEVRTMQKLSCTAAGDPTCVWQYEWIRKSTP